MAQITFDPLKLAEKLEGIRHLTMINLEETVVNGHDLEVREHGCRLLNGRCAFDEEIAMLKTMASATTTVSS